MSILKGIRFKGKSLSPFQIVNNKYYYKKDGKIIKYQLRVDVAEPYYVDGDIAVFNRNAEYDSTKQDNLILTSALSFSVEEEELIVTSI